MGRGLGDAIGLGDGVGRGVAVAVAVAVGVAVGLAGAVACGSRRAAPCWCPDGNRHGRACLKEAYCCVRRFWRLIGVEPEVVQCAAANRIRVLILSQKFPCSKL